MILTVLIVVGFPVVTTPAVAQFVLASVATVQPFGVQVTFVLPTHCVAETVLTSHCVPAHTEPTQVFSVFPVVV